MILISGSSHLPRVEGSSGRKMVNRCDQWERIIMWNWANKITHARATWPCKTYATLQGTSKRSKPFMHHSDLKSLRGWFAKTGDQIIKWIGVEKKTFLLSHTKQDLEEKTSICAINTNTPMRLATVAGHATIDRTCLHCGSRIRSPRARAWSMWQNVSLNRHGKCIPYGFVTKFWSFFVAPCVPMN